MSQLSHSKDSFVRPPSRQRIRTCKRTQDEKENNPVGVLDPLRPEKADLRGVGPTVGGLGVGPRLALGPLLLAGLAASHGRFHLGLLGLLHLGITKGITIKALHEHSLLHSL